MPLKTLRVVVGFAATIAAVVVVQAVQDPLAPIENRTPNTVTIAGDAATTLGGTVFVNHGLVGVGRIPAATLDAFVPAETFGSISGMQVTDWVRNGNGTYSGILQVLPDRGYNSGNFFSHYAARIQRISFAFTPYLSSAPIGGADTAAKIAAQNQMLFTSGISGEKFTYVNPGNGASTLTTGLDPGAGTAVLFGKTVPFVYSYTGAQSPSSTSNSTFAVNRLPIDAEALVLKADGSGYIGDEYAADIYYFDANKRIVGVIVTPPAIQPRTAGAPDFNSIAAPGSGRRNNQGLEGVALSPDGTRLFAMLQSATIQDSNSLAQNRKHTRLLVYDISTDPTPSAPVEEYAVTLPVFRINGDGSSIDTPGAQSAAAAQSEILALDNHRFLVLSRDGNGLGNVGTNQSVFKSVLLLDTRIGSPTNFADDAARNAAGGRITSAAGVLAADIRPVVWTEVVNMLNETQLAKFNIERYVGGAATQVSQLTLGEKWEGLSLVPALDPERPDDYYLFVGNDNDFLTATGQMIGPDGSLVFYDAFAAHDPKRQPANGGPGNVNANDTMILIYRVTLAPAPEVRRGGFVYDRATGEFVQSVQLVNTSGDALSGPMYLALDRLSSNATLANVSGSTTRQLPLGNPYVTVLPAGSLLAPGASTRVVLRFLNPTRGAITYDARPLVLTGNPAP